MKQKEPDSEKSSSHLELEGAAGSRKRNGNATALPVVVAANCYRYQGRHHSQLVFKFRSFQSEHFKARPPTPTPPSLTSSGQLCLLLMGEKPLSAHPKRASSFAGSPAHCLCTCVPSGGTTGDNVDVDSLLGRDLTLVSSTSSIKLPAWKPSTQPRGEHRTMRDCTIGCHTTKFRSVYTEPAS